MDINLRALRLLQASMSSAGGTMHLYEPCRGTLTARETPWPQYWEKAELPPGLPNETLLLSIIRAWQSLLGKVIWVSYRFSLHPLMGGAFTSGPAFRLLVLWSPESQIR